jgi:hypothetical protein
MRLAQAEALIVLTILLKSLSFQVIDGQPLKVKYLGAADFVGGVHVSVGGMRP